MAIIGENFPLTKAARKEHLDRIKGGTPISSSKIPGKGLKPVFCIPLQYLSYNPHNTRFLAKAKTLEKRFGCRLSDEIPEHIKEIEKFIWFEKEDKNEHTINSLIKDGQLQPGVVTADGIILSGNRRFRLLNEITRNPDKYANTRIDISALNHFEAVILDEAQLSPKDIIEYESFFQFGIEDKVEYDPIEKYIGANDQKDLGFTPLQIARHFMSITEGKESKVKEWLEVYSYMAEYLEYIGEEGIYTALDGREEAFLQLRTLMKSFTTGRAGSNIWAYNDVDLVELKLTFFDYIRLNIPTHNFRLFKEIFCDEEPWKNFRRNVCRIIEEEGSQIESFEDYREKYPDEEETGLSKRRQNDYKSKVDVGLNRIYGVENGRIQSAKAQEYPLDILKAIQQRLSKLESDMNKNDRNETYDTDEFVDAIHDIQRRVGWIIQKVE